MKLAQLRAHPVARPVLVVKDGYIDIGQHIPDAPPSMTELIRLWPDYEARVMALESHAADGKLPNDLLAAPITRPGKIFAIGLNYADHCEETGQPLPAKQIWFTKASTAVHPPFASIEIPAVSNSLDYEAELVVVIGKTCRNVPEDRWREVVFGYCIGNDVSVREWQIETPQWSLGKSFDTCAPIGPWITTTDSVDPHALDIKSYVNGELRQGSNTRHLVFKIGAMVAKLSAAMTLEPGDLIFTGTPGGVGMMWKGAPHYLKPGDRCRIEIDQLGAIEAVVREGSAEPQIG
jgi:2-keto-4-pentenoate hydratase/2-oxohepta-3-ene-1,7-dioic acid hydratase in catechol pathway